MSGKSGEGMLIAVSDFDGTIKMGGTLAGDLPGTVRRWRERGNRFGIATGRDWWMTVHETDLWSLPFDFLVCINGAAIYDADGRLLRIREFEAELTARLLAHPAALASQHYLLLGSSPIRFYHRGGSWFPDMGIAHNEIGLDEANAAEGVAQISLSYENAEICEEFMRRVQEDFGSDVAAFRNGRCIDLNRPGVNKSSGIAALMELTGWTGEVLTIGDGGNDMEMISDYTGFAVPNALPEIKAAARGEFENVPEMLLSHM